MKPKTKSVRVGRDGELLEFFGQFISRELVKRLRRVAKHNKRTANEQLRVILESAIPKMEKEIVKEKARSAMKTPPNTKEENSS